MSVPGLSPDSTYHFVGSDYPPVQLVVKRGTEETHYNLSAGKDDEPRGMCLIARPLGSGSAEYEPKFVLRVPDLRPLPIKSKRAYINQFEREVNEEVNILTHLSKNTSTRELLGGDANAQKIDVESYLPAGISTRLPTLKRNFVKGISLRDYRDRNHIDFKRWFDIAEQLISAIHAIHLAGTPHGYICPTNVIVSEAGERVHLVNFERDLPDPTLHLPNSEERILSWRRPYDSPERRCFYTTRPGSAMAQDPFVPGDLYSLGLTLLWLAVEKPLCPFEQEEQWRGNLPWRLITNPLKKSDRRIRNEIRVFVNPDPSQEDYEERMAAIELIFACLRMENHRFYNARAILEVLRQCKPNDTPDNTGSNPVGAALQGLYDAIDNNPAIKNTLIGKLYRPRLARALLPFIEKNPIYRYTVGNREDIVRALEVAFGEMKSERYTRCKAMTTATFFSKENCSPDGRVLSAIQRAAFRKAKIKWLMVLNETRLNDPNVIAAMNSHEQALRLLESCPDRACQWLVKWLPLDPEEYRRFLREHESFLYFDRVASDDSASQSANHLPVLVVPDYAAEPGKIIALRAFPLAAEEVKNRAMELQSFFDKKFEDGYPLTSFPHLRPI